MEAQYHSRKESAEEAILGLFVVLIALLSMQRRVAKMAILNTIGRILAGIRIAFTYFPVLKKVIAEAKDVLAKVKAALYDKKVTKEEALEILEEVYDVLDCLKDIRL